MPLSDVYLASSTPLPLREFTPSVNAVATSSNPVERHAEMTVLQLFLVWMHTVHILQVFYCYTTVIAIDVNLTL